MDVLTPSFVRIASWHIDDSHLLQGSGRLCFKPVPYLLFIHGHCPRDRQILSLFHDKIFVTPQKPTKPIVTSGFVLHGKPLKPFLTAYSYIAWGISCSKLSDMDCQLVFSRFRQNCWSTRLVVCTTCRRCSDDTPTENSIRYTPCTCNLSQWANRTYVVVLLRRV